VYVTQLYGILIFNIIIQQKDEFMRILFRINILHISAALIPVLMILILSCTSNVKSTSDIGSFQTKVSSDEITKHDYIEISGIVIDSALWIKSYNIEYDTDTIHVSITRSLKRTGNNGPYHIKFIIPDTVNSIFLENEVIWKRNQ